MLMKQLLNHLVFKQFGLNLISLILKRIFELMKYKKFNLKKCSLDIL